MKDKLTVTLEDRLGEANELLFAAGKLLGEQSMLLNEAIELLDACTCTSPPYAKIKAFLAKVKK